jgi:hypothetical protein
MPCSETGGPPSTLSARVSQAGFSACSFWTITSNHETVGIGIAGTPSSAQFAQGWRPESPIFRPATERACVCRPLQVLHFTKGRNSEEKRKPNAKARHAAAETS